MPRTPRVKSASIDKRESSPDASVLVLSRGDSATLYRIASALERLVATFTPLPPPPPTPPVPPPYQASLSDLHVQEGGAIDPRLAALREFAVETDTVYLSDAFYKRLVELEMTVAEEHGEEAIDGFRWNKGGRFVEPSRRAKIAAQIAKERKVARSIGSASSASNSGISGAGN